MITIAAIMFIGLGAACGFGALLACSTPTWGDSNG